MGVPADGAHVGSGITQTTDAPFHLNSHYGSEALRKAASQVRFESWPYYQADDGSRWGLLPLAQCTITQNGVTTPATQDGTWGTVDEHWYRLLRASDLVAGTGVTLTVLADGRVQVTVATPAGGGTPASVAFKDLTGAARDNASLTTEFNRYLTVDAFNAFIGNVPAALDAYFELVNLVQTDDTLLSQLLATQQQQAQQLQTNTTAIANLKTATLAVTAKMYGFNDGGVAVGFDDFATAWASRSGNAIQFNAPLITIGTFGSSTYNQKIFGNGRWVLVGTDNVVPVREYAERIYTIGKRGGLIKGYTVNSDTPLHAELVHCYWGTTEIEANVQVTASSGSLGVVSGAAGSVLNLYGSVVYASIDPASQGLLTVNDYRAGGATIPPCSSTQQAALQSGDFTTTSGVLTGTPPQGSLAGSVLGQTWGAAGWLYRYLLYGAGNAPTWVRSPLG